MTKYYSAEILEPPPHRHDGPAVGGGFTAQDRLTPAGLQAPCAQVAGQGDLALAPARSDRPGIRLTRIGLHHQQPTARGPDARRGVDPGLVGQAAALEPGDLKFG